MRFPLPIDFVEVKIAFLVKSMLSYFVSEENLSPEEVKELLELAAPSPNLSPEEERSKSLSFK